MWPVKSLFHTKEGEEGGKDIFQGSGQIGTVTVSHHWSNKSLILWRFSCEALTDVTHFGYHALPCFL